MKNTKKIISFSVYGSDPKYVNAILENIKLQPEIYPEWICRIYLDETISKNIIKEIEQTNSEVIIKIGRAHV